MHVAIAGVPMPGPNFLINEGAFEYYGSLRRVRKYVMENFPKKITLAAVARVASMERTYFSAFFHRKVGVSFRDWLRELRIQKAMWIMSECDDPIARVGRAVGFSQIRSFERAFKKATQQTPVQYRRENLRATVLSKETSSEFLTPGIAPNTM